MTERPHWWQTYSKQEFMTPGVEETLEILATHCQVGAGSRVLEVGYGKGEAACRLAQRFDCRVVGIDRHDAADYAMAKARARLLSHVVSFVRADGAVLPVATSTFDIALCTGGPSIVGTIDCMKELHRILKPAGWAVVSDWVWRNRPPPPEALPLWEREHPSEFVLLDEYARQVREAGFEVVLAQTLPQYVWHGYYAPMLEVIEEMRQSGDPELQARAERSWSNEPRTFFEGAGRDYWGYAVFVARKLDERRQRT
jgi:SAM-dependent methyltransferase